MNAALNTVHGIKMVPTLGQVIIAQLTIWAVAVFVKIRMFL